MRFSKAQLLIVLEFSIKDALMARKCLEGVLQPFMGEKVLTFSPRKRDFTRGLKENLLSP